jgi:hypothetical protein
MTKIDLRKPHLCNVCKEKGMFYFKKWWCGHDKYLEGHCKNEKRKGSSKKE